MEYTAVALAVFGVIIGLRFRFRVLLPFALLLPLLCVAFALTHRLGGIETLLTILTAEAVLQGGYVIGLIVSASYKAIQRKMAPPSSQKVRSN
jgi:small basic protein